VSAKGTSEQFPDRAAVVDAICERLARGEGLTVICRDKDMPCFSTVYDWRKADKALDEKFDVARKVGFDAIAESCIDIADAKDEYRSRDSVSGRVRDPKRDKLRVWTRMQLLAKWDPKRYGEMQKLEHSGSIGIEQLVAASRKPQAE